MIRDIFEIIKSLIIYLISRLFPKTAEKIVNKEINSVDFIQEIPKVESKYLWDTRDNVRHSIRVICDEEKLSVLEKNLICSVINCESNYNPKCVNLNNDGTYDYGLCQYNSKWYIEKMKLITKDQALNDPEFCVRLMIQRYKRGFLKDWVCYKSGRYKSFT